MKKASYLFAVVFLVIAATSCSKSGNDLPAPGKSVVTTNKNVPATSGKFVSGSQNAPDPLEESLSVYRYITEPYELELGDPKLAIIKAGGGTFAVFYTIVSEQYSNQPVKVASFNLSYEGANDNIGVYEMHPAAEADKFQVKVPEALIGQHFYFAIVPFQDLDGYTDTNINIGSDIIIESGELHAELKNAFVYTK